MSSNFSSKMEKFGKALFTRIKIPYFLALIASLPILSFAILSQNQHSINELEFRFFKAIRKAKSAMEKKGRRERFLERHSKPDPYFLDTQIESLHFLTREIDRLKTWSAHPAIPRKELIHDRMAYLQSEDNRLTFVEEEIQTSDLFKETIEKQRHPIQVDTQDLAELLSIIEDVPKIGGQPIFRRPQLLITDFSLKKMKTPLNDEVFELNIDLLKREFQ